MDPDSLIKKASTDDVWIVATYFQMPFGGQSWDLRVVNNDLYVYYAHLGTGEHYDSHVVLTPEQLQHITDTFESAQIFSLSKYVANSCCYEDPLTLQISAAIHGKKGQWELQAPQLVLENPETKRFRSAWNALFEKVKKHPIW
jgi:hypothetical protein